VNSLDPLNGIMNRRPRDPSPAPPHPKDGNSKSGSDSREKSEKLMRERSIKTNRRHKFVECLSSQDVNIGRCPFFQKRFQMLNFGRRIAQARMGWYTRRPSSHGLATSPRQLPYFTLGKILLISFISGIPSSSNPSSFNYSDS
jgi:hypothetical protein